MSKFDPTVYLRILSVHQAYAFDLGCILMRIYMYMGTIGIVSMLTLSGHSALFAGTVSSMLAISTFFISPRTGKFMDELGQRRVVAITSSITLCGVALLLLTVAFGWPSSGWPSFCYGNPHFAYLWQRHRAPSGLEKTR